MKKMHNTAFPCGYAVEGLGFYFIPVAENPKTNLEEKSAVVRVLESSLTADQLTVELEKLLPGKHKWEIEERGTDAFVTNFPSSNLLDCVVNWGPMDTKTVKGKNRFEKGGENDVYNKYEIDKVWVQFRGLPKEFREFPIIWAIGSILGVFRAVDTKFTKKYGRARMKVAVLDPTIIPNFVDIVIGDYVYELQFRVEDETPDGEPQIIDMDSTIDEDDPKGEKKEDPMDEDGKKEGSTNDNVPKAQLPDSGMHSAAAEKEISAASGTLQIKEIGAQSVPPVVQANKKPTVVLSQCGLTTDGNGHWKANVLNGGTVPLIRSSKRCTRTSGQDSLEKASKLKARKNLDSTPGKDTLQGNPLASTVGTIATV